MDPTAAAGPRPRSRRRRDTEHRLAHDVDVWVAWREADELPGRDLVRDGRWLA